jgi:hypothetical protein
MWVAEPAQGGFVELELIAQYGVFSTRDALRAGVDGHALALLCRSSVCTRLTHGWYAVGTPASGAESHRLTAIALGRAYGTSAAISHSSALVLLDLPMHGVDMSHVHLTRVSVPGQGANPWSGQSRRRPGLMLHREQDLVNRAIAAVRPVGAPLVVPVAHAVVGAGLIARPTSSLVAADAALARDLMTKTDLDRAIGDFDRHRGIGPVRSILRHVDSRHESPGESLTAYLLEGLGHTLEPQFTVVAEGRTYRADFRIVGTRVLVEFDGRVKYDSGDQSVLFDEKRREDALRRAGWIIVRLVWADLSSVGLVRDRLDQALRMAAAAA